MADKILHKRSLTPGSIPTTASLNVGELAINVPDGKLYLHQSGSISQQIVNVGESASFAQTASYAAAALTASYLIGGVTIDTGSLVTTASFNAYTGSNVSQFAGTASFATATTLLIRRSDYTGSIDPNINLLYLGEAENGSAESATVWTISQLSISSSGATVTRTTSSAAWTNRYSYTYL